MRKDHMILDLVNQVVPWMNLVTASDVKVTKIILGISYLIIAQLFRKNTSLPYRINGYIIDDPKHLKKSQTKFLPYPL